MGTDGYIEVYDNDTNTLIHTFTSSDWSIYSASNPYTYEYEVGHIRIETSEAKADTTLNIYHIKEIDDEKIIQDFTEIEFNDLAYIESNLKTTIIFNETTTLYNRQERASYMAPESIAVITNVTPTYISTGETAKNVKIQFSVTASNIKESKWKDGTFLLKFPSEILDVEINNITINKPNVIIQGYDIEKIGDDLFLKIQTENEVPDVYSITITADITADSRAITTSKDIELYAYNPTNEIYASNARTEDIYDINGNGNLTEYVAYSTKSIDILAPSGLITAQTITDYNNNGDITVSPQVAEIDKPDSTRTAQINVYLKSNYEDGISEIKLVGKIPFENNTSQITDIDLGSTYTANMTSGGITIPEELEGIATVYYSVKEQVTNDLNNPANGWTTTPSDFSLVKTYLIDMGEYVMQPDEEQIFSYTVEVPGGTPYNGVSYSTHAVYFYLHTEGGKLADQTETNKAGIRIARKYDVELTKYKEGTLETVQGATYSITADGETVSKIGTTNALGKAILKNLYVEKIYTLKEIGTTADYELNESEVEFIIEEDEFGELELRVISGSFVSVPAITLVGGKDTLQIKTEDREKYTLIINKTDEETTNPLQGIIFNIKGKGKSLSGSNYGTNATGQAKLTGLYLGEEYTLTETKATGYYLDKGEIVFKLTKASNGTLTFNILEGGFKGSVQVEQVPGTAQVQVTVELENEKIPTYNLNLTKIEKGKEIKLEGAKFVLRGPGIEREKIYTTNEFGELTIEGLYAYVAGKNIDGIYELEEIYPPEGYGLNDEIVRFRIVQDTYGDLSIEYIQNQFVEQEYEVEIDQITKEVAVTFENSPLFKLTKKDGTTMVVMPNVKFAIFEIDEEGEECTALDANGNIVGELEEINGVIYRIITTDELGEISIGLKKGLYKLIEMETLEGYYLPEQIEARTYYFGIQAEETITKTWKKVWNNVGNDSDDGFDKYSNIAKTKDGGFVTVAAFRDPLTIPAEETVNGIPITLTTNGYFDWLITKYNSEWQIEYARSVGGTDYDEAYGVSQTEDGGYIVVGYYRTTITIPAGDTVDGVAITLTSVGLENGLIIKYNCYGKVEYAKSSEVSTKGVTETENGEYVVIGRFYSSSSTITIPAGDTVNGVAITLTENNNWDEIIIKYNNLGQVEYAKNIGATGSSGIYGINGTEDGGYIIERETFSTITISGGETVDGVPITLTPGNITIKYNSAGKVEYTNWNEDQCTYEDIIATEDGGYVVVGNFYRLTIPAEETIDGVAITLTNNGARDGLIIKYNNENKVEYAKSVGGTGQDYLERVMPTSDGGCIVIGRMGNSPITIPAGETADGTAITLTNVGSAEALIIKYNSVGQVEYAKNMTGTGFYGLTETSDKGYAFVGGFNGTIVIPAGETADGIAITLTSSVAGDCLIIKYNSEFEVEYAKSMAGGGNDFLERILVTSDGGYVVVGGYGGTLTIPAGDTVDGIAITLTGIGYVDGLIIKYNSAGQVECAKSIGADRIYVDGGVSQTKDGGYVVAGYFYSGDLTIPAGDTADGVAISLTSDRCDGIIIKYNSELKVEYVRKITGSIDEVYLYGIIGTEDGGYAVAGSFAEYTFGNNNIQIPAEDTADGQRIIVYGIYDNTSGLLIKYNNEGKVEYITSTGGLKGSWLNGVTQLKDGGIVAAGKLGSTGYIVEFKEITTYYRVQKEETISKTLEKEWDTSGNDLDDEIDKQDEAIAEIQDGGYVKVGGFFGTLTIPAEKTADGQEITLVADGSYADGRIIKYNSEGKVEYAKRVGGSHGDYLNGVIGTQDGGYVVVGEIYSDTVTIPAGETADGVAITLTNKGDYDSLLIKYNSEGKVEYAKNVGGLESESFEKVIETKDGGYLAIGHCWDSGAGLTIPAGETVDNQPISLMYYGRNDWLIIKFNNEGKVEFAKNLGGEYNDYLYGVTETKDGGYVLVGDLYSSPITISAGETVDGIAIPLSVDGGLIVKYNNLGKIEYAKNIEDTYFREVTYTLDGGYIVEGGYYGSSITIPAGETEDNQPITLINNGSSRKFIIKYNSNGKVEYAENATNLSLAGKLGSVVKTQDGGYIVAGNYKGSLIIPANETVAGVSITLTSNGVEDCLIIKYNSEGKVEYAKSIGEAKTDRFREVIKTKDGGYIAVGEFFSDTLTISAGETVAGVAITLTKNGNNDGLIIKYDSTGKVEYAKNVGGAQAEFFYGIKRYNRWRIYSSR